MENKKYRITVLTEELIRLEYSEDGLFEDRPTQMVCRRDFPSVQYEVHETENRLEIITGKLQLIYDKSAFSPSGLSIRLLSKIYKMGSTWHYGDACETLGGTIRTLDKVDGAIPLGDGIMSKFGFSYIDDSDSFVIDADGEIRPRERKCIDGYFFGYGRDYKRCLKDFFYLCGSQPLLPKYALGNWWSRYYKYSTQEYLELMDRFHEEKIPFTVAVLDMDWHIVDVDIRYGSGWTGYTWNRELIPDPQHLLEELHSRGMRTTLNVHPADGVLPYEDAYEAMKTALGRGENSGGIEFDLTDPEFRDAYFKYLHHPNEEMGVDFWWIDWQQGTISSVGGLDPLWLLNHYHFKDIARSGERPMILSRYAGIGSHRYPLGFSGDSIVTWDSLDFQPYLTSTASNVGYGWWSHDIGGHFMGQKNDELALRWVQYGVFSPINRLHSSDNPFDGKEPWRYSRETEHIMKKFLQLRHKLIPYLHAMNYQCHQESTTLIEPMYYEHPWSEEAYEVPNMYYFGTELLAAPVTEAADQASKLARVKVWLPEGIWTDIFTGRVYRGNRTLYMYRDMESIPVFAKAGAILPLYENAEDNQLDPAQDMELRIYAGADGEFHLYEDEGDGSREGSEWADTKISLDWRNGEIRIHPVTGNTKAVPKMRNYRIRLINFGEPMREIMLDDVVSTEGAIISVGSNTEIYQADRTEEIFAFLNQAQMKFADKNRVYKCIKRDISMEKKIAELFTYGLSDYQLGALLEILTV